MHPLRVALFLDGRPGHEKQSKGIIKALQEIHPVNCREIHINRPGLLEDIWLWIRYFLGLNDGGEKVQKPYDLVIGTGTHTHIPMLGFKRRTGAMACTCMSPSTLLKKRFDICFIPQHDGIPAGKNVYLTVGPPNCSRAGEDHDPDKSLILLGGTDPKSHFWDSCEIAFFIEELVTKETDKQWIISSSPRTPAETISLIEKLALQFYNIKFFRYQDTEAGWIERQYSSCKTVWVTADSMSMVYEALSAGCNVGLLPVTWKNKKSKFKRSEKYLLDHGLVASFAAWQEGNIIWNQGKPLAEAQRCANEILRVWHLENSI